MEEVVCTEFGFDQDREFAVVDLDSKEIMTQRKLPKMAMIKPRLRPSRGDEPPELILGAVRVAWEVTANTIGLPFVAHKLGSVELDLNAWLMSGSIYSDSSDVTDRNATDSDTISDFLDTVFVTHNRRYGLVKIDKEHSVAKGFGPGRRRVLRDQLAMEVAGVQDTCAFHDVAPFHIASEASLLDLNSHLTSHPVPMSRFRANIIVRGNRAWDEEYWVRIAIGGLSFRVLQGCVRCAVPTVDQETGMRPDGHNPTAMLRRIQTRPARTHGPYAELGPYFGVWAAPDNTSRVSVRVRDKVSIDVRSAVCSYHYWSANGRERTLIWTAAVRFGVATLVVATVASALFIPNDTH